jgi:DNA-binding Lrp family transcriptional regulator
MDTVGIRLLDPEAQPLGVDATDRIPRQAWCYSRPPCPADLADCAEGLAMVRGYVLISTTPGEAIAVAAQMKAQAGVIRADAITGDYDCIAQVEADDLAGIGDLIVERIQRIHGVFKTVTCLAVYQGGP